MSLSFLDVSWSCFPPATKNIRLQAKTFSSRVYDSVSFSGHSCHHSHESHSPQFFPPLQHDATVCIFLASGHRRQVLMKFQYPLVKIFAPWSSKIRQDCQKSKWVRPQLSLSFFICLLFSCPHSNFGQENQKYRVFEVLNWYL